ncbi:MAG: 2,3-bisphosphoglycerate-independent phosphoglycerate mutase [Candidatus Omnitrophica bacterium]|nr:2,3-bisphosphoglycerate-independent phosphoglycerate mutase [Candidatus Omnitrophota bacterium]
MIPESEIKKLSIKTNSRIVLLVIDGLGGLPYTDGKTELEAARIPNLDNLVRRGISGATIPVSYGITPGSGPAHLSLFGYDPLRYEIGRGVLEALGIGLELSDKDLAARGNFATMDKEGVIIDRRAGRISDEENKRICKLLQKKIVKIEDTEVLIKPGKEHRFVILFRGESLEEINDTDPQEVGKRARKAEVERPGQEKSARIVNEFVRLSNEVLKNEPRANTVLLRGICKCPPIPSMSELFKLKPAAIATYPMYRGLARLVGMEVLDSGLTIEDEFRTLKKNFSEYDFFYLHIKKTDSYGEDGNRENKIKIIEEVDSFIPRVLDLAPDVLVITGDHSTPALLKGHSWHPNPFLLYSKFTRVDGLKRFSERECVKGGLGIFSATEAMPLMLANALKLKKWGA